MPSIDLIGLAESMNAQVKALLSRITEEVESMRSTLSGLKRRRFLPSGWNR